MKAGLNSWKLVSAGGVFAAGLVGAAAPSGCFALGGACSLDDGTCRIVQNFVECTTQNGVYRGDGTVCVSADQACTVLVNGGFELGTLEGWTQFGNTQASGVQPTSTEARSGLNYGSFGPVGDPGGISQIVHAAIGAPLEVRFWYRSQGTPQSFSVSLGGRELVSLADDTAHQVWTLYTFSIFAPVANPELRFTFRNDPLFTDVDDIRVCAGVSPWPACYANCDQSTVSPVLNINDFQCFVNKFAAGCS